VAFAVNKVSNFLEEIQSEYSRIRGKYSPLSPIDWQLAQSWEDDEIPLHLVLRAMSETWRNFQSNRTGTINTLRYFEPEVKKQFAEYLQSQIGKNTDDMNNSFTQDVALSDDYSDYISCFLLTRYDVHIVKTFTDAEPSTLLSAAIKKVRSELIMIIEDINSKQLPVDEIEARLKKIAGEFEISLIADFSDQEREQIIKKVKEEYGKLNITDELLQKILIRKLYEKFNLPELTLFAF
jgi:predicted phage-related endonuclease